MGQGFLMADTAATLLTAGVQWTMQILNYPLLVLAGHDAFPPYIGAHNRRVALVVLPGDAIATASMVRLLADRLETIPLWAPDASLALALVVIVPTAALQAPLHAHLVEGWSEALRLGLVLTNWIRVAAASGTAGLSLWTCSQTSINQ